MIKKESHSTDKRGQRLHQNANLEWKVDHVNKSPSYKIREFRTYPQKKEPARCPNGWVLRRPGSQRTRREKKLH